MFKVLATLAVGAVLSIGIVTGVATAIELGDAGSLAATEKQLVDDGVRLSTRPEDALSYADAVLSSIAASGNPPAMKFERIRAEWLKATALGLLGRAREAKPIAEAASSEVARFAPESILESRADLELAYIREVEGNPEIALRLYKHALEIVRKHGDAHGEVLALEGFVNIYTNARDYRRAVEYSDQIVKADIQDLHFKTVTRINRAFLYMSMGDYGAALPDLDVAVLGALKLKSSFLAAHALTNRALCEIFRNRIVDAQRDIDAAQTVLSGKEAEEERPFLSGLRAILAETRGDYQRAALQMDLAFKGVDLTKTDSIFLVFHKAAVEIYARVNRDKDALDHLSAEKRIEDAAVQLAFSHRGALLTAEVDSANEAFVAERAKRDMLQRITLVACGLIVLFVILVGVLFYLYRQRGLSIKRYNDDLEKALAATVAPALSDSGVQTTRAGPVGDDIRSPLSSIVGMAEVLLLEQSLPLSVRERLSNLSVASRNIVAAFDHSKDQTAVSGNGLEGPASVVDLHRVVRDAAAPWGDYAKARGIDFRLNLSGAPPAISGDADLIHQVLSNLISNAVKFTDQGFIEVSVETSKTEPNLTFTVTDSGIGVSQAQRSVMFDGAAINDDNLELVRGGAGVGLSLSKRIAESLGGRLTYQERAGGGSCFRFEIPLRVGELLAGEGQGEVGSNLHPLNLAGLRVLVLESNPAARRFFKDRLGSSVRALEFTSGAFSTLHKIRHSAFERLIVDWESLQIDQDGLKEQCLFSLHQMATVLPVVVTTSSYSADLAKDLRGVGVYEVIRSPFSNGQGPRLRLVPLP